MFDWEVLHFSKSPARRDDVNGLIPVLSSVLGARVAEIREQALTSFTRLKRTVLPMRSLGNAVRLYLADGFADIDAIVADANFEKPAKYRIVWVFDTHQAAEISKYPLGSFDLIILAQSCNVQAVFDAGARDVLVLPIGTDALKYGSGAPNRPVDVLRIGPQPGPLDDDDAMVAEAAEIGIRYSAITPDGYSMAQRFGAQSKAKFAMLNVVHAPEADTVRHQFGRRWADALASGASVFGIPPMQDRAFADLMWTGALVETRATDRTQIMLDLRRAIANWNPEQPRRNYLRSLERLDWRWRIRALCDHLATDSEALNEQLGQINDLLDGRVTG